MWYYIMHVWWYTQNANMKWWINSFVKWTLQDCRCGSCVFITVGWSAWIRAESGRKKLFSGHEWKHAQKNNHTSLKQTNYYLHSEVYETADYYTSVNTMRWWTTNTERRRMTKPAAPSREVFSRFAPWHASRRARVRATRRADAWSLWRGRQTWPSLSTTKEKCTTLNT